MSPDYLELNGAYAAYYFDKLYKIVIILIKDYKNYNIYAKEYEKVMGKPAPVIGRNTWYSLLKRIKGE
ncbi:MAG TPA: hypothetical protein VGK06_15505 [Methanosarcina sp.]